MSFPSLSFDILTFVSFVLPPLLGYFVVAVLAVTTHTHAFRVALWPVVTLFALRAAVSVDMSPYQLDEKSCDTLFVASMSLIIVRTFEWTLTREPLMRHLRPAKGSRSTIVDALDLATTLRGYGWDWSHGVHIPPETRPTNRRGFTFHVILSAAFHAFICGILYSGIRSFSPTGLGALSGGSIFDETLPFYVRYLRASVISAFALITVYSAVQGCYDTCTIVAVLVFQQDLAEWPPVFDAPWRATSLADFWGRRWHQFFRRTFIILGGYPFSIFLGRAGLVIGSFLSSGFLHHVGMGLLNKRLDPWRLLVGFGMMGPVILTERAFKQFAGRKVGGAVGWVWTMTWLLLWGNLIIDGFARGGVFGHFTFVERVVPLAGQEAVQRLVVHFDAWLHAM